MVGGAGEGFDFVCEALDIGFGGAFGLFLFRQGGRLRVGIVPVHQIAAAVELRVMQAPTKFYSNPVSVKGKKQGGATSSLPMQQRIGQRGRCPSRCGDESGRGDAAPPGVAANRPMTKSKRPMTKRHEPHVRNKTPHDEIDLTAAA